MSLHCEPRYARACPGHIVFESAAARKPWLAGNGRAEAMLSFGRLCPAMTVNEKSRSARKSAGDRLLEDLPADLFVGEGSVAPPPAVLLHLLRRGDKAFGDLGKIRVAV